MEGGLLRVRRQRGIPAGPDVRPPHCGARRRVGGPHHLLPGQRYIWCCGSGSDPFEKANPDHNAQNL